MTVQTDCPGKICPIFFLESSIIFPESSSITSCVGPIDQVPVFAFDTGKEEFQLKHDVQKPGKIFGGFAQRGAGPLVALFPDMIRSDGPATEACPPMHTCQFASD